VAIYLRRVGIASRSYAAAAKVSTVVTSHVPAAQNLGEKKGREQTETQPQQVMNNAVALQHES
jgi:hypothetical protein